MICRAITVFRRSLADQYRTYCRLHVYNNVAALVDTAYCYRQSSVVCRSVCHDHEPCKNG